MKSTITTHFFRKILCFFFLFITFNSIAQQPAFPGAEGAGMFTSGGRGTIGQPTTVFEVTNLSDVNTTGSLRFACTQSINTYAYRTIVFRVSGTIHLTSKLQIPRNTTIAGQTAPGDGICLADYPVEINGDNVIVRYLRIRLGDKNQLKTNPAGCGVPVAPFTATCAPVNGSGNDDAFGDINANKNIIVDHCTISWSDDEAFTIYRGDSITLQWNYITEPLNYSYHFELGDADFETHGFGGIWGAKHGTFHHNMFAHCNSRNPRFGGINNSNYGPGEIESCDFRNNVIYNWQLYTVYGGEGGQYNLVNNYYKYGPSTGSGTQFRIVNVDSTAGITYAKYFLAGNYVDGSPTNTNNNWSGAYMMSGLASDTVRSKVYTPFLASYPQVTPQSATDAYEAVLMQGGATLPRRDTLDRRIVNDVRFRKGRLIDVQGGYAHGTPYAQTLNAWPTLNSTTPLTDTDHDGMPDSYETANGLNPNLAADRQTVAANGYTNLENYLNSITNTSPEVYFTGSLNGFSQTSSTPSAEQSLQVSGTNLSGNVILKAPAGFQISTDHTNWYGNADSIVLIPVNNSLSGITVYIRLNTTTEGNYIGNILATTPGVTNFYFSLSGTRTIGIATGPLTVTWPLASNEVPTISLNTISASNQTLGSAISGTSYGSSFGGISNWQRTGTISFLPVGYNANAYQQYTVTPQADAFLHVSSFNISALGGGTSSARMAIYYSLDNFATSAPLGVCGYNNSSYQATVADPVVLLNTSATGLTGQQVATIPTSLNVLPSQTLSIRVYAWISGTGNRYFASQNVNVIGSVSAASAATDYFRSKQSGNWNDAATWETSADNSTWQTSTRTPDFNANTISIQSGHTVTVTADVTADQLTINPGGNVIVKQGVVFTVK